MADQEREKSMLEQLVEEQCVDIGGKRYEIRPWSLGHVKRLLPVFGELVKVLQDMGALPLKEDQFDQLIQAVQHNPAAVLARADQFLPMMIAVLSITMDMDTEEVESLPVLEAFAVVILVVKQNADYLKNFFGPQIQTALKLLMA